MTCLRRGSQNLDDTDRAIIEQLQQDGRLSYTGLAAATQLSDATVRQRIQRLMETGAMRVVAVTDPLMLGRGRMAMIGVRAEGDTASVVDKRGTRVRVICALVSCYRRGRDRGSPNHGSTLLSKWVIAQMRSPVRVRTMRPVPYRMPVGALR